MNEHKEAALICLRELRAGTPRAEMYLASFAHHAKEAKLSLDCLGTDAVELEELVASGRRMRAGIILRELRLEGSDRADSADLIREIAAEAGCTLEDLGTTEEELISFPRRHG